MDSRSATSRSTAPVIANTQVSQTSRQRVSRQLFLRLRRAGVTTLSADSEGGSALSQIMSLVLLGDYVSTYLAFLYGVDPTPTIVIDELKAWLNQQK